MTFKAKLIAVTKPIEDMQHIIGDAKELVTYCARVSNPSNQANMDTAEKLINYLMKHRHWSPLEMVNCVVEVECPRDIARQLLRHRSFSFQEYSQRYADVSALGDSFVIREVRLQDTKNRQNSITTENTELQDWWLEKQNEILQLVSSVYKDALAKGVAKECARVILPEGNTMSRLYVNGTIRSWIHYLQIRMEEGVSQREHVMLATLIADQVCKAFDVGSVLIKGECYNGNLDSVRKSS